MSEKDKRHLTVAIGCPKDGHAAFRVGESKLICECGEDFTKEAIEAIDKLKKLLNIK